MRLLRRLSIRWRITIGSVLIAAVLLTGAAFVFRAQIEHVQLNADRKLLYDATAPYLDEIIDHPDQIDEPAGEQHLAVLRPDGTSVVDNLPDSVGDQLAELTHLAPGSHLLMAESHEYLIVVRVVTTDDGEWHVVASRDQKGSKTVLANLTNILILGAIVLLIGFGLASWLLTTAALRPVSRMRAQAETLRITGSDEPLPSGPAHDELWALAQTLNSLIGSVRDTAARERQMVSDASHELRTPLAILRGQLELAQANITDPAEHARDLTSAAQTAERLSALATNLLQLSAVEADDDQTTSTVAELADEFRQASDRARILSPEKRIDFEFDAQAAEVGSSGAELRISELRFGQILDNLLSNAVRATPVGGTIRSRLSCTESEMTLTVSDSGPGLPEQYLATAFDRFSRPDERRRSGDGGSGLGLAIVAAIVRNAGGHAALGTSPAGGTRADVSIPLLNAER